MKDNTAYVDAAIATLRQGLAGKIAAENALGAPVLPVPGPDRILFGGEEGGPIVAFPAVEVAAPDRTLTRFSLGQEGWDVSTVVAVRGWLSYDENITTYQTLYRAIGRFSRALLRVLVAPDAFGTSVVVDRIAERLRSSDPQADERQDVLAFTLLVFTLLDVDAPDA